jgi:hypothetical protein
MKTLFTQLMIILMGCILGFQYPYSHERSGYLLYGFPLLAEPKAPHIGHQKHLCKLTEGGDCTLEEIKTLVKDAKFICKKCGRAASAEENLCEPVSL